MEPMDPWDQRCQVPATPTSQNRRKIAQMNVRRSIVYYATAMIRFFVLIWRLQITFPDLDILLYVDGIEAAFRRILYSPEMAILFAYVFGKFLIIPVGQVFGSRLAPSFFSMASDIHADLATTGNLTDTYEIHPQATEIQMPSPPDPEELTPAIADLQNPPMTEEEQANY